MFPVFFKEPGQPDATPALPGAYAGLRAGTLIARGKDGPFAPLAIAFAEDATLREAFARALDLPLVQRWAPIRLWLLIGLTPLLMLAELDRELASAGIGSAGVRIATDFLVIAVAAIDLARRLPRHPRTTALLLFGGAARYLYFIARACGHGVHPTIFIAPIVAATAGALLLRHAPRAEDICAAILARLGIASADATAARDERTPRAPRSAIGGTRAHVAVAVIAAMGLPLLLAATRLLGVWPQAPIFAGYALLAPYLVARVFEPARARARLAWERLVPAAMVAFALTVGMTNGAHYAFDGAAYATRCVNAAAFEGAPRRALDAEGKDVSKNVQNARESLAYFLMTVLVVPLAEERVFRAMLQRVLARRWGNARAIAFSSLAFGLAHLGVYKIAVYQTVLLGVGFGVAFAGGGYLAAALAHLLWNLSLVL